MATEAELRERYQTNRFRNSASASPPTPTTSNQVPKDELALYEGLEQLGRDKPGSNVADHAMFGVGASASSSPGGTTTPLIDILEERAHVQDPREELAMYERMQRALDRTAEPLAVHGVSGEGSSSRVGDTSHRSPGGSGSRDEDELYGRGFQRPVLNEVEEDPSSKGLGAPMDANPERGEFGLPRAQSFVGPDDELSMYENTSSYGSEPRWRRPSCNPTNDGEANGQTNDRPNEQSQVDLEVQVPSEHVSQPARRSEPSTAPYTSEEGIRNPVFAPNNPEPAGGQDPVEGQENTDAENRTMNETDGEMSRSAQDREEEIELPRWQPDAEMTHCPICSTQFSFFIRKHHCRKCGRVVCSSCSPHRITIPHQFIVHPPTEASSRPGFAHRDTEAFSTFGGTKVRLCNPCVPDPNTLPPSQPQRTPADERWRQARPTYFLGTGEHAYSISEEQLRSLEGQTMGRGVSGQRQRAASNSTEQVPGLPRYTPLPPGRYPPRTSSQQHDRNASYTGGYYSTSQSYHAPRHRPPWPHTTHHSVSGVPGPNNPQAHYRSMIDVGASPATDNTPPLPPVPRTIAEEDECWVCHRELPDSSLPNAEELRAAHVQNCIDENSGALREASSSSPGASSPGTAGRASHNPNLPGSSGSPPTYGNSSTARRTLMFPYTATEKDCVDDAECTICMEEFAVGDEMGRLECFCRFHRACIMDWWSKQPNRCPVHGHNWMGQ